MQRHSMKAFTLIELLIVVAIIAILAAIAVPNFLEAQTRSKVAREKADMRTQDTALQAYFVDYNMYTRDSDSSLDAKDLLGTPEEGDSFDYYGPTFSKYANGALQLTTPVAYISTLLQDPFVTEVLADGSGARGYRIASGTWSYDATSWNANDNQGSTNVFKVVGKRPATAIIGVGPDGVRCRIAYKCFPFAPTAAGEAPKTNETPVSNDLGPKGQPMSWVEYDPTNGTTSVGDIYRFGGSFNDGCYMLNGQKIGNGPQSAQDPNDYVYGGAGN